MKKIKKVLALVLIFAFIVAFAAISASAAQVEEPECCNHDEIVVPARAVPVSYTHLYNILSNRASNQEHSKKVYNLVQALILLSVVAICFGSRCIFSSQAFSPIACCVAIFTWSISQSSNWRLA